MGILDRLRGKKPESGDEQYERITGAKKKNDEVWEKATGYDTPYRKETLREKAENVAGKAYTRGADAYYKTKKAYDKGKKIAAPYAKNYDKNSKSSNFDMMGGGVFGNSGGASGKSDNMFSFDMDGGGLFSGSMFDTGITPRKKHKKHNKKSKTQNGGKNIHIHIHK
jgi:hypothetical protein